MLDIYSYADESLQHCDDIKPNTWVRLVSPTTNDIEKASAACGVQPEKLAMALDENQISSFEDMDDGFMLIINIPLNDPDFKYAYTTVPLGIFICKQNVITICLVKMDSFMDQVHLHDKWFDPAKPYRFSLELLLIASQIYSKYMLVLNHDRHDKVRHIEDTNSTPNSELMQLHGMETTFVYFESSLGDNKMAIDLLRDHIDKKRLDEYADLLDDVADATDDAINKASLYRELLQSTRDLYSSIVDNNLNTLMKFLTGVTIVLAIPAIVTGILGMNVEAGSLPLYTQPHAFGIVVVCTIALCACVALILHKRGVL